VRPRWQPVPPAQPPEGSDWAAVGITQTVSEQWPYVEQLTGETALVRDHRDLLLVCSFYGPNSARSAERCRAGLMIEANRYLLGDYGVKIAAVGGLTHVPELTNLRWVNRVDLTVTLRQERDYVYAQPQVELIGVGVTAAAGDRLTVVDEELTGPDVGSNFIVGQSEIAG